MAVVELGHALDQRGDLVAELRAEPCGVASGVLDNVVEQGSAYGGAVQADVENDLRHGDGVGDVRVAALAYLTCVAAGGELISTLDPATLHSR